jgi:putative transposase
MINSIDSSLPISKQCELTNVNRSTWYYAASDEPAENIRLMDMIDELHLDHPTWGSRTLRDHFRNNSIMVNRKRIQRLMAIMRINVIYPKRNLSRRNLEHRVYPYLLRELKIDHVNQVWSTDITYIRMEKGWAYLVAVMDWHSRAILSWKLSNTCDTSFCVEALQEALARFGRPAIFNTDQGSTFTAPDFLKVLEDNEVRISMNGKGRAFDNIFIERFWRSLKQEEVYLKSYENLHTAEKSIGAYIDHYNNGRPHRSLGGWYPIVEYHRQSAEILSIVVDEKTNRFFGQAAA